MLTIKLLFLNYSYCAQPAARLKGEKIYLTDYQIFRIYTVNLLIGLRVKGINKNLVQLLQGQAEGKLNVMSAGR